jgi:Alginate lyase
MHHPWQLLASCALLLACSSEVDGSTNTEVAILPSGGSAGADSIGVAGSSGRSVGESAGTSSGGGADVGGNAATAGSDAVGGGGASASAGASGSSGASAGGGAGVGGATANPGPIDFARWVLQLPTGSGTSPTTISSAQLLAGFSNEYFYAGDDGGQMFMDPATGITTSGSTRCRTEMREQTPGAGSAAWASSGTNTMTVEGKVVKLGGGSVTVAQVFNADDSIPLCELQYTSGHKFSLFYEESKGGGGSPTDLKTPVALNTRYTFSLALSAGKLSVSINGKEVYTHTPSAGILSNKFYFKVGNYDQSTSAGTPSKTPYSIVEAYKVDVVHQ